MSTVRRLSSATRRWRTWVGSMSELARVVNLINKLAEQRKQSALSGFPIIEAPDDTDDWQKVREAERRNESRLDLTKKKPRRVPLKK